MSRLGGAALALVLVLVAAPSAAGSDLAAFGKRLAAAGKRTSTLRADFVQRKRLRLFKTEVTTRGRIAYQRRFTPATESDIDGFRRHARGNSLFANNGDGTFRDVTEEAGVTMGRWAWGAEFVDLNGDDLEDIYIPNGFITNEDTKDL